MAHIQRRARYARTPEPGGLRVNAPAGGRGIPSGQEPVVWYWGSDNPIAFQQGSGNLASVTRATSLIVNTITSAPWRLFKGGDDPNLAEIEEPAPIWLTDPMLLRPDERVLPGGPSSASLRMPQSAFWSQWVRSALLRGMGYLVFKLDADGGPKAGTLKVLNPDYVSGIGGTYGEPVRRRISGPMTTGPGYETDEDGLYFTEAGTYQLVELTNPLAQIDELGMTPGVLAMHARELGLAEQAADYGSSMMRSGVPSGFLKVGTTTFSKAQAEQLRSDWMAAHGGDGRAVAVLSAAVDFTPIQMSPLDLALIETRKMSLVDVANAFGVPVYMLGGGESSGMTYSNAESRGLDFKTYTLLPWAKAAEDVLSSLVPNRKFVRVDFRGLTRADTGTRYASYQEALTGGWLTIDEVRRLEGLPPLPESVGGRLATAQAPPQVETAPAPEVAA